MVPRRRKRKEKVMGEKKMKNGGGKEGVGNERRERDTYKSI